VSASKAHCTHGNYLGLRDRTVTTTARAGPGEERRARPDRAARREPGLARSVPWSLYSNRPLRPSQHPRRGFCLPQPPSTHRLRHRSTRPRDWRCPRASRWSVRPHLTPPWRPCRSARSPSFGDWTSAGRRGVPPPSAVLASGLRPGHIGDRAALRGPIQIDRPSLELRCELARSGHNQLHP
jgi:hypothetical protein